MAKQKEQSKSMGDPLWAAGLDDSYLAKNYLFVIAINDYEKVPALKNCVRDAEEVIKLLTEEFEFEREQVVFICGGKVNPDFGDVIVHKEQKAAQPTRDTILAELYKLAGRIKEDQETDPNLKVNLVLYYSGHGHLDKLLDQGYWIPIDAGKHDYGKHISNSTISDFLSGIKTHHTLVLSDSCFSGSIFSSAKGKSIDANRLEQMPSRWGITAGRNEIVSDGSGKHSPFAESFLANLKSSHTIAADALGIRIRERVASNVEQTPLSDSLRVPGHENGIFVFRKKVNAFKHFEAGMLILRLARLAPDYSRYRAATYQFELAYRLSSKPADQAVYLLWEARSLAYAGLYGKALQELTKQFDNLPKENISPPLKHLQFSLALLQHPDDTIAQFKHGAFAHLPRWMDKILELYLASKSEVKNYHFLGMGINKYTDPYFPELSGCVNDVDRIAATLTDRLGKKRFNVQKLVDEKATYDEVIKALKALQQNAKEEDWVFIHFSSHAWSTGNKEEGKDLPFIVTHNAKFKGPESVEWAIGCQELHEHLQAIPCRNKVVILDVDHSEQFAAFAQQGNYTLFQGASAGERAQEKSLSGKSYGLFSYAFTQALEAFILTTSKEIEGLTKNIMRRDFLQQCPFFLRTENFIDHWRLSSLNAKEQLLELLKLLYGPQRKWKEKEVGSLISILTSLNLEFTAREWLRLGDQLPRDSQLVQKIAYYENSLKALADGRGELTRDEQRYLRLQLADFYAKEGSTHLAGEQLLQAKELLDPKQERNKSQAIANSLKTLKKVERHKKYALLVGISHYQSGALTPGALKDVEKWETALAAKGYEGIITLKNEEATEENILREFGELADKARQRPAFFFFAGIGTGSVAQNYKAIFAYDSDMQKPPNLGFSALAKRCEKARHLTVVVDAGFEKGSERYYPPTTPDSGRFSLTGNEKDVHFGNVCLLPGIVEKETGAIIHRCLETAAQPNTGVLTSLLITRLLDQEVRELSVLTRPDQEAIVPVR